MAFIPYKDDLMNSLMTLQHYLNILIVVTLLMKDSNMYAEDKASESMIDYGLLLLNIWMLCFMMMPVVPAFMRLVKNLIDSRKHDADDDRATIIHREDWQFNPMQQAKPGSNGTNGDKQPKSTGTARFDEEGQGQDGVEVDVDAGARISFDEDHKVGW